METINITDFKTRCLAVLDRVQSTGEPVLILKRGRLVAELLPARRSQAESPQMELEGTVTIIGDIIEPIIPEQLWDSPALVDIVS